MVTHRVSVDVSSEEGVMYAGVPARQTREYEQWTPTPFRKSASTVYTCQLVHNSPMHATLGTLGTFVVTQSDCRLICLSHIFKGVI